ncbi:unnamed protein product [Ostreobium quekettii]|uniref:Protein kinase domain-containing protein n=1 Tax=Ostreobium quekettii TaxID=121088 RepID=A0A8S1JBN6_9CHLO|nr:unnamed protein product [Ostreobium quekettii]
MLPEIRYNVKTLAFLHACMTEAKSVQEFPNTASMFTAWNNLVKAIKGGRELVLRHTREFDLWEYYTVDETVYLVNNHCRDILKSADQLKRHSAGDMQKSVPDCIVEEDRNFLEQRLGFVVGVLDHDSVKGDRFLEEWAAVRSRLEKQVQCVQRINRGDVNWKTKLVIADGGRSTVYSTSWMGREVALKVMNDSEHPNGRHGRFAEFFAEIALNAKFGHPHIVRMLAMSSVVENSGIVDRPFLVMELAKENLETWYKRQHLEAWPLKRSVLFQAAEAVCHLHSQGVVHRDIKPQNILVFPGSEEACLIIKLCDLGVATKQSTRWRRRTQREQPGTFLYQAPELFDGKRSSPESDVFSFGTVMVEVVAGCEPYGYKGYPGLKAKADGRLPCAIPNACPQDLRLLIQRCLLPNPDARPTMREVQGILNGE